MYNQKEIDLVVEDVKVVLTRFEESITETMNEITMAKAQPLTPESFASLNRAQDRLKKINLEPVIDTLEGIIAEG
jgi:hypothetical protein